MSAENPTIKRKGIFTRINDFIAGGPLKIPDTIVNLETTYRPLPTIVFDSPESKALNEALAEVDAATAIARSGADPKDPLVLMYFTKADGRRSFPSQEDLSARRVNARLEVRDLLNSLGVGKQLTISQPGDRTPTHAIARSLHRVLEARSGPAYLVGESDTNPPVVLFIEEHVSKIKPAGPTGYTTERTTSRRTKFAKIVPH